MASDEKQPGNQFFQKYGDGHYEAVLTNRGDLRKAIGDVRNGAFLFDLLDDSLYVRLAGVSKDHGDQEVLKLIFEVLANLVLFAKGVNDVAETDPFFFVSPVGHEPRLLRRLVTRVAKCRNSNVLTDGVIASAAAVARDLAPLFRKKAAWQVASLVSAYQHLKRSNKSILFKQVGTAIVLTAMFDHIDEITDWVAFSATTPSTSFRHVAAMLQTRVNDEKLAKRVRALLPLRTFADWRTAHARHVDWKQLDDDAAGFFEAMSVNDADHALVVSNPEKLQLLPKLLDGSFGLQYIQELNAIRAADWDTVLQPRAGNFKVHATWYSAISDLATVNFLSLRQQPAKFSLLANAIANAIRDAHLQLAGLWEKEVEAETHAASPVAAVAHALFNLVRDSTQLSPWHMRGSADAPQPNQRFALALTLLARFVVLLLPVQRDLAHRLAGPIDVAVLALTQEMKVDTRDATRVHAEQLRRILTAPLDDQSARTVFGHFPAQAVAEFALHKTAMPAIEMVAREFALEQSSALPDGFVTQKRTRVVQQRRQRGSERHKHRKGHEREKLRLLEFRLAEAEREVVEHDLQRAYQVRLNTELMSMKTGTPDTKLLAGTKRELARTVYVRSPAYSVTIFLKSSLLFVDDDVGAFDTEWRPCMDVVITSLQSIPGNKSAFVFLGDDDNKNNVCRVRFREASSFDQNSRIPTCVLDGDTRSLVPLEVEYRVFFHFSDVDGNQRATSTRINATSTDNVDVVARALVEALRLKGLVGLCLALPAALCLPAVFRINHSIDEFAAAAWRYRQRVFDATAIKIW